VTHLPPGAARYFWSAFDGFYEQRRTVLQVGSVDGVVSFRSFHIVMGLITVLLWTGSPFMVVLSFAWCIFMVAATVPIGGHYFIDLVAGALIWVGWFILSERLARTRGSARFEASKSA